MKEINDIIRNAIDSNVEHKIAPTPDGWERCATNKSLSNVIEGVVDPAVDTVVWEAVRIARDWD